MRLLSQHAGATFVSAILAVWVVACGGGEEENPSAAAGTGGQNLSTTGGRGGVAATQTGTGGSTPNTTRGGQTAGAGGGSAATTGGTATDPCVVGGACSLDVASLARDGLKQCTSTQGTCYCATEFENLSLDDADKLLSTGVQGTWACEATSKGNSRGRGNTGAGGTSTPGTTTGRGGVNNPGTTTGRGGVSSPVGGTGGSTQNSTSTNSTCPTTTPQNGTACTLDGYHCSTCICAGGTWTCT
jgi:hypothetical protein